MPETPKWTKYIKEVFKTLIIIRQLRTVIPERWETKWALWPLSFLPRESVQLQHKGAGTQAGPGDCSELRRQSWQKDQSSWHLQDRIPERKELQRWRSGDLQRAAFPSSADCMCEELRGAKENTPGKMPDNSACAHAGLGRRPVPSRQTVKPHKSQVEGTQKGLAPVVEKKISSRTNNCSGPTKQILKTRP